MNVEGGSTIHDWSCPIKTLNGTLEVDAAGETPIGALSGVQKEAIGRATWRGASATKSPPSW
jgi:hypothetical protein